ncbi:formyltetrahydrofolate deformylase [Rhodococcoides trifolii]|uniref:Formyltetrahydrofolate deformylase n=1 Tax=Rhodococcoides trifolii TaxID=908250 RepID=A0A917G7K3_9NOCA|nr:formyltetrahydrofolate deformylase [Rhodococcus trifolii]GGG26813.1 formyltetrahydrofolate deformylase [Rhodococcus trifolii]
MSSLITGASDLGVLIVKGDDREGIVAAVSALLAKYGANIVSLDQYSSDPAGGRFFQRTTFHLDDLASQMSSLSDELENVLHDLGQTFQLTRAGTPKRVAIMASKTDHCLLDLLWRQRRGDIHMKVAMVISNHPDLGDDVRGFGIPFFHVPVDRDARSIAEQRHLELLTDNVDLVVLARYMQILSGEFLQRLGAPVINIHHSFLPAFIGSGPYQKAKDRGVKLVGATAHYVTEDLDEGPIIEQDVVRVSHAQSAAELQRKGADVERQVLSRAVAWHCDDRVIRDGNQTVVF